MSIRPSITLAEPAAGWAVAISWPGGRTEAMAEVDWQEDLESWLARFLAEMGHRKRRVP
jgi:hypothetical protein